MNATISTSIIRRAGVFIAAAVVVPVVALAASGCGGHTAASATAAVSGTTNGLEKKSPADVLQGAAAALTAAKSVHVVATVPGGHLDLRLPGGSSTGTITRDGVRVQITVIGNDGYVKTDRAGLHMIGAPRPVQRHGAGRWIKLPAHRFSGLTLASIANQLTTYYGPLEPKVQQATVNGRKEVIVRWRNGSQLYVANTGPAYPLRGEFKGQNPGSFDFTEYGVRVHIAAPGNAEATA